MIIEPKKNTMAYRCASCAKTVFGLEGALNLTGDMLRLKCDCGGSDMTIKSIPGDKVRVTLPCIFCGAEHMFTVSKALLITKDLFTYQCPYTGVDVAFFGGTDAIREAVGQSDEKLTELFEESEDDADDEKKYPGADESIRDMITLVLGDLYDEGKIGCECGKTSDAEINDGADYVDIVCKKCGCGRRFFCEPTLGTFDLLSADGLTLTKEYK